MTTGKHLSLYAIVLSLAAPVAIAQSALEEVVVTARKRDESFQDVPASVTAFTEDQINSAGIERPADYIALTPNMTLVQTQNQGTSFVTIRGISQARNSEPSAAILIDGVLQANPSQFNQELYDIQQIEVLKGPQGALYGRNAIGGAITIRTKQPTDEFEAKVQVGYDDGPGYKVRGSASGPIPGADTLKYRGAISYYNTDGWIDNPFLGEEADPFEDISGRFRLLWEPNDVFSADLRFSISEVDTQALYFNITGSADDTSLPVRVNNAGVNERDMWSVSLKLDYDTSYGTLTSITAYDDLEEILTGDQFDFLPIPESIFFNVFTGGFADASQSQFLKTDAISQEIRFTSPGDQPFRWIAGAYAIASNRFISTGNMFDFGFGVNEVYKAPSFDPLRPQFTYLADTQDNFAWAVFGEISYDVSELLEVSLSLRYDRDNRKNRTATPPAFIPAAVVGQLVTGQVRTESWDDLQPKATLRFQPSDDWTLYAGYSRGFRSGGFNQTGVGLLGFFGFGIPGVSDIFDQETADTIEGGAKAVFWDGKANANFSIYKTRARGSYFFVFDPDTSTQNLGNIDKVDLHGFEFAVNATPTDGLDLYLGLGYTDSEIKEIDPALAASVGNQAPLVSEYTLNLGAQYRRPLPMWDGVDAFVRTDFQLIGPTYWDPPNTTTRNPVDLLDLRFGVAGQTWDLTFWGKNITDTEYNSEWSPGPPGFGNFVFKGTPARWGIDFSKSF